MYRILHFFLVFFIILGPVVVDKQAQPGAETSRPAGISVRYHPDGGLVAGDWVSIEVTGPAALNGSKIQIDRAPGAAGAHAIATAVFSKNALESATAVFLWTWDTRGLAPGEYPVQLTLEPEGRTWEETIRLAAQPLGNPSTWRERDTHCCRIHTITGTAAERDIDRLAEIVDEQAATAARQLGYTLAQGAPDGLLDLNFVPRVLGQGGFTDSEVIISYSDENYTASDIGVLIHHELIHRMDAALGGDYRPTMLAEGLAVYLSGGHYQPEPVVLQAAALVQDGRYIPLSSLAEDFYSHQHEESYLEAAALVNFMVRSWGWDRFNQFYRDIHLESGQTTAQAIDTALERHFGVSLEMLDLTLGSWVARQPMLPDLRADLGAMVAFYDAIRETQMEIDPSAYFRQVWLPDPAEMRKRGITADYLRGPDGAIHQSVISFLRAAGQSWRNGQYRQSALNLWQASLALESGGKKESLSGD